MICINHSSTWGVLLYRLVRFLAVPSIASFPQKSKPQSS